MTTWRVPAAVDRLVDGDTVRLALDLGWHIQLTDNVRIAHINAPELSTPAGLAARDYAATLLPAGAQVMFTSHSRDKYGRCLGDLQLPDGRDFATEMLIAGHAVGVRP